jgi:hypothetical protein
MMDGKGLRRWRELVTDRKKMEGYCSTGQSPQQAVVPMEEEEDITAVYITPQTLNNFKLPLFHNCPFLSHTILHDYLTAK